MNRLSRQLTLIGFAFGALLASACNDGITAPAPASELAQISRDPAGRPVSFTRCSPQPSDSASARIGPSGGILKAGKHMLRVPAGALKRSVLITMTVPSDSLNYVVFGPEGLTFDLSSQPTLLMSYRNCFVTEPAQSSLAIVYANDSLTAVLDTTEGVPADTLNHTVGARLKHFSKYVLSRYAVAF